MGSDVVAGWDTGSSTSVDDYLITAREECSGSSGVCKVKFLITSNTLGHY